MKKNFTNTCLMTLLVSGSLCACSKAGLKEDAAPAGISLPYHAHASEQTAQSVSFDLSPGFPYFKQGKRFIRMDMTLAVESVEISKPYPDGIYSFSLKKDGSCSKNLQFSFDGSAWKALPHTIVRGCNDPSVLNTDFYPGQTFGNAVSFLKYYDNIGNILASDGTTANDGACGNADIVKVSLEIPLNEESDHVFKVKGQLNGLNVYNELPFAVDYLP